MARKALGVLRSLGGRHSECRGITVMRAPRHRNTTAKSARQGQAHAPRASGSPVKARQRCTQRWHPRGAAAPRPLARGRRGPACPCCGRHARGSLSRATMADVAPVPLGRPSAGTRLGARSLVKAQDRRMRGAHPIRYGHHASARYPPVTGIKTDVRSQGLGAGGRKKIFAAKTEQAATPLGLDDRGGKPGDRGTLPHVRKRTGHAPLPPQHSSLWLSREQRA